MNKPQPEMEAAIVGDFITTKAALVQQFKKLMSVLDMNQFPEPDECYKARQLLLQYEKLKTSPARTVEKGLSSTTTFYDPGIKGARARDIIKEITADPEYISILHKLALMKVLPTSCCAFSKEKTQLLVEKGYIIQYAINIEDSEVVCFSLSSKGWLCFTRKTVVEQLKKRLGIQMLYIPADLCLSVSGWETDNFVKALVLSNYCWDEINQTDYLVFSYPENRNLLFGCVSRESGSFEYSTPVLCHKLLTKEDLSILEKIIKDRSINKLTLLFLTSKDKQAAERIIDPISSKEGKLIYQVMENGNE